MPFKLAKLAIERVGAFAPFARIIDLAIAQTARLGSSQGNPAPAELGGLVGRAAAGIVVMEAQLDARAPTWSMRVWRGRPNFGSSQATPPGRWPMHRP
jgi:hypothetical protein